MARCHVRGIFTLRLANKRGDIYSRCYNTNFWDRVWGSTTVLIAVSKLMLYLCYINGYWHINLIS